ncbi:MAG: cellulase family glycosylhydrolase [Candidatus Wildermuthbacteria bacterium]|nr:cellulase family glycosylhydrolase [Candidatus Wildermuthbacteria bacterium]
MIKKTVRIVLFALFALFAAVFVFFFVGKAPIAKEIVWGVNFSQKHAINMKLDWKETFLALLDELGAEHVKISIDWDMIQGDNPNFFFQDVDWQMRELEKRGAKAFLVIGNKTTRWPECHIPSWVKVLPKDQQQSAALRLVKGLVERYKNSPALEMWQAENEPFFPFGECQWSDIDFVKKEVALIKSLDQKHPVVITASGEWSLWRRSSIIGDMTGSTLYRRVWFSFPKTSLPQWFIRYPFPPVFYWRRALLADKLFSKKVIVGELQAEPWSQKLLYDTTVEEQAKTMNPEFFREIVSYAKRTGLNTFYLWGSEWWYWMKVKQNNPEMWEEAKKLFEAKL